MGGSREQIAEEARRTDLAYHRAKKQIRELECLTDVCRAFIWNGSTYLWKLPVDSKLAAFEKDAR